MLTALLVATALAQAEPAAPAPDEPGKPIVDQQPANPNPNQGQTLQNQSPARRSPSIEEVNRQLERIKKLPASEMTEALEKFRSNAANVKQPQPSANAAGAKGESPQQYLLLSETEQVMWHARNFFNGLIAGDARGIVLGSGYPFYLEDRRLELPEELHDEWLKNLRSKRTDLLTLYDIEILTPAEMEKKYGKPPARLKDIPWKNGKTYLAVGNLSGHPCVAVFREAGPHQWQLVGYTD